MSPGMTGLVVFSTITTLMSASTLTSALFAMALKAHAKSRK